MKYKTISGNFGNVIVEEKVQSQQSSPLNKDGKVGIETTNPGSKQTILGGDIYVATSGNGLILKDTADGSCHRVVITNDALSISSAIACPAS